YSKIFDHLHVKGDLVAAVGSNIASLSQKLEKLLKLEPQDIQDEVKLIRDEQVTTASMKKKRRAGSVDKEEGEEEKDSMMDPQDMYSNIQQCGPALCYMVKKTGWAFSMIMGGPNPLDPVGGSVIVRYPKFLLDQYISNLLTCPLATLGRIALAITWRCLLHIQHGHGANLYRFLV
ncbi:hypothetical protein PAXRUDRAFT_162212, partial [Paxillus rubicundulus Ve08.2h10]